MGTTDCCSYDNLGEIGDVCKLQLNLIKIVLGNSSKQFAKNRRKLYIFQKYAPHDERPIN